MASTDLKFHMSVIGQQTVKKSVLEIKKEMDELSKFGQKGGMSTTEIKRSENAFKALNRVIKEAEKGDKQYLFAIEKVRDRLKGLSKDTNQYAKNQEKLNALRAKYGQYRETVSQPLGNLKRSASNVRSRMFASQNIEEGSGGSNSAFGNAMVAGLGVPMTEAAIGYIIAKIVTTSFSTAGNQLRTATDIAGISRGGRGLPGLLAAATGITGFAHGGGVQDAVSDLRYSNSDAIKAAYGITATGQKNVTGRDLVDTLAMARIGVSQDQSNALRGTAVRGDSDVKFSKLVAIGVTAGMTGVRSGEFIDSINKVAQYSEQTASKIDIGNIGKVMGFAAMTGNQMLMGDRGANSMTTILDSLLNPGGGVAGQLSSLRAGGFGGVGGKSLFQAKMALSNAGSNPSILRSLLGQFKGGTDSDIMAFAAEHTNNNLQLAKGILTDHIKGTGKNGKDYGTLYNVLGMSKAQQDKIAQSGAFGKGNTLEGYYHQQLSKGGDTATSMQNIDSNVEIIKNALTGGAAKAITAVANPTGPNDGLEHAISRWLNASHRGKAHGSTGSW